jgi:endonuclease VIII
VPEGDTIAYAAARMRPVLEGTVPDEIVTPQPRHRMDRWPDRLAGRTVREIRTHGKHLFLAFEGDLVIHSHLRMTGSWGVYPNDTERRHSARRAWLIFRSRGHDVVQFGGPVLELLTEGRARFDHRLSRLGPDVLAAHFEAERFLSLLRSDDQTRGVGDALLDQRNVAGIGNIWKSEGCWEAAVDPWRPVSSVSDAEAVAIIGGIRPRMLHSAQTGRMNDGPRVFRQAGRPCPRCGTVVLARAGGLGRSPSGPLPAGNDNRTTFWCPGCQR